MVKAIEKEDFKCLYQSSDIVIVINELKKDCNLLYLFSLFKREPHKMVKHTQLICRLSSHLIVNEFHPNVLKAVWQDISVSYPFQCRVYFWCKLSSTFLVAEPREWYFELFRMQNSQKISRVSPLDSTGEGLQWCPRLPQWFFSLLRLSKNWHPQKLVDMALHLIHFRESC